MDWNLWNRTMTNISSFKLIGQTTENDSHKLYWNEPWEGGRNSNVAMLQFQLTCVTRQFLGKSVTLLCLRDKNRLLLFECFSHYTGVCKRHQRMQMNVQKDDFVRPWLPAFTVFWIVCSVKGDQKMEVHGVSSCPLLHIISDISLWVKQILGFYAYFPLENNKRDFVHKKIQR